MNPKSAESLLRLILPYYLIFIFIGTVAGAIYGYQIQDGWMMGDWLINYQGGLIRRGLLGEGIYRLTTATGISPGLFVLAIHIFLYGLFFCCSYRLLRQQKSLLPYCLLIFSPFVFTFQINSLEGGFRKEIIFVGLFSYFVYLANSQDAQRFRKSFILLLLFYPLVILTHEMLALLLPYFLIVYFARLGFSWRSLLSTGSLLSLSVLSLFTSLYFSGNQLQVDTIKQSLIDVNFEIIGGALDWLAFSTAIGLDAVKGFIVDKSYLTLYGLALMLAALAYVPVVDRILWLMSNKLVLMLFGVILVGAFSLFAVAIDWGRFIYMHLIALFLLTLLRLPDEAQKNERNGRFFNGLLRLGFPIGVVMVVLYSQIWFIPHCCTAQPLHLRPGDLNIVSFLEPFKRIFHVVTLVTQDSGKSVLTLDNGYRVCCV